MLQLIYIYPIFILSVIKSYPTNDLKFIKQILCMIYFLSLKLTAYHETTVLDRLVHVIITAPGKCLKYSSRYLSQKDHNQSEIFSHISLFRVATFRFRLNSLCFPCVHDQFPCVFQYINNKYYFYKWPAPPLTAILSSILFNNNITS